MDQNAPNLEGNAILQNEQGDVVAIVTDINSKDNMSQENTKQTQQHVLSTDSNQNAEILPALIADTTDNVIKSETDNNINPNKSDNINMKIPSLPIEQSVNNPTSIPPETLPTQQPPQQVESRWTKENRIILKQLMGSLPPHDIGAALRVILDTFGVESSKLVRRGEFVELDLQHINDDYILDSLWNYCAQMQFNIMNTLQQQQQPVLPQPVSQQFYYQQPVQQPMYQQMPAQQQIYAQPITPVQQQMYMQPQQQMPPQIPNGAVMQPMDPQMTQHQPQ